MFKIIHAAGIYIPAIDLWLDARKTSPLAVISHAHADHVARHEKVVATPETIALIRTRFGAAYAQSCVALAYGQWLHKKDYSICLYPAGHTLGSSMVLIEYQNKRMLYTGDFKLRPNPSCESIQIPQADFLLMESTFGLPKFNFPNNAVIAQQINQFCDQSLGLQKTPILLAYSLGKAQEALKLLEERPEPIFIHPSIAKINKLYERFGHPLASTHLIGSDAAAEGIFLLPPAAYKAFKRPKAYATAMLSGWGIEPHAKYRYKVDQVIPLSDHADYSDLIDLVKQVQPKEIITTHGYEQAFAASLRSMGYNAWSLKGGDQLELGL